LKNRAGRGRNHAACPFLERGNSFPAVRFDIDNFIQNPKPGPPSQLKIPSSGSA